MHSFGFDPKTLEQIEREKQEAKKRMELESKEYSLLLEKQEVEKQKRAKLASLFNKVKKDPYTNQCCHHIGILDIDSFKQFLKECRKEGKLENNQTLVEDLQSAIQEKVGY